MAGITPGWDQRPDYIEACRTQPRPGDPTTYVIPHPPGATPTDVTDFKVGHARWNENNMPDIMYELYPPQAWKQYKDTGKPQQKVDANGQLMWEQHPAPGTQPRPMLDFPALRGIDKVSTNESSVWWEMMFRLEPSFTYSDGIMRMEYAGKRANARTEQVFKNTINMDIARMRTKFNMLSWRDWRISTSAKRDEVIARLNDQQKQANSTRGSTPGLIDPSLPDTPQNRVPIPLTRKGRLPYSTKKTATANKPVRIAPRKRKYDEDDDDDEDFAGEEDESNLEEHLPAQRSKPNRRVRSSAKYTSDSESEDSDISNYEPLSGSGSKNLKRQRTDAPFDEEEAGHEKARKRSKIGDETRQSTQGTSGPKRAYDEFENDEEELDFEIGNGFVNPMSLFKRPPALFEDGAMAVAPRKSLYTTPPDRFEDNVPMVAPGNAPQRSVKKPRKITNVRYVPRNDAGTVSGATPQGYPTRPSAANLGGHRQNSHYPQSAYIGKAPRLRPAQSQPNPPIQSQPVYNYQNNPAMNDFNSYLQRPVGAAYPATGYYRQVFQAADAILGPGNQQFERAQRLGYASVPIIRDATQRLYGPLPRNGALTFEEEGYYVHER